jgi:hypothetical protein
MPCSDGRDSCYNHEEAALRDNVKALKKKLDQRQEWLDEYAQMLCRQCKIIEGLELTLVQLDIGQIDPKGLFDPQVAEWWEKHKIEDAAKEKAEQERKAALNKKKLEEYLKLKQELDL